MALAPEGKEEAWASAVQSLLALAGLTQTGRKPQGEGSYHDALRRGEGVARSFRSEKERWVPNRLGVRGSQSFAEYATLSKMRYNGREQ